MKKAVEVVPYDPKWPEMFELEASRLKETLGANCIAVLHVGSTAVPGLTAKPKIDIIAIVKDTSTVIPPLEEIGYEAKGEFNIPFHVGFAKRESRSSVNLHVYEEGNPEIELNLLFRDYLRTHSEALEEYANLKWSLLSHPASHEKNGLLFRGYTLGKDEFIKKVLQKSGFKGLCMRFCTHHDELKAAKEFRRRCLSNAEAAADLTVDRKKDVHFMFYQGVEVIGYAYVELLAEQQAALRIFVFDKPYQDRGFENHFLTLFERWLKRQGYRK